MCSIVACVLWGIFDRLLTTTATDLSDSDSEDDLPAIMSESEDEDEAPAVEAGSLGQYTSNLLWCADLRIAGVLSTFLVVSLRSFDLRPRPCVDDRPTILSGFTGLCSLPWWVVISRRHCILGVLLSCCLAGMLCCCLAMLPQTDMSSTGHSRDVCDLGILPAFDPEAEHDGLLHVVNRSVIACDLWACFDDSMLVISGAHSAAAAAAVAGITGALIFWGIFY